MIQKFTKFVELIDLCFIFYLKYCTMFVTFAIGETIV